MKFPAAWSFSRLNSYETCPRKFFRTTVLKDLKEEESEAMAAGTDLHHAFRDRLKTNKPLPLHLRHHEAMLARIAAAPGEKSIEQQIAFNAQWEPVDWFAKDTWVRVISDLTQLNGSYGICWDWKTGRQGEDFTQLKLNAAVTFLLAPELNTIKVAFYWTKNKALDSRIVERKDLPDIWGNLLPRVAKYQEAHDTQDFPPRPNNFCKGCVVKDCQYWSPRR